jgi:arylformamidase
MVTWPGDPPVRTARVSDMEKGDGATLTRLDMGVHAGTHMDAPLHFLREGKSIDEAPFDALIGPARVIEVEDPEMIRAEALRSAGLFPGERVLLKTLNSSRNWPEQSFDPDFVHMSAEAAAHLAEAGVRTVGVDYLSVGGYRRDGADVHRHLLGAGIWIIEGLHLGGVPSGRYDLICLPIKLAGCEGAPARAVLRRWHDSDG